MEENSFVKYLNLIKNVDSIKKIRMMHLFRTLGLDLDSIPDCIENFRINIDKIPDLSAAAAELLTFKCLSKTKISREELDQNVTESQKILDAQKDDDSRDLFELFSSLDDTFLSNMEASVPHHEYENYKRVVSDILRLNLSLNYDLHQTDMRMSDFAEDYSDLTDLDFHDKIGQIVDSIDFNRACNTEDRYVISECQRLLDMINEQDLEDESIANTNPAKVLKEIIAKLRALIEERSGRLNSPSNQGYRQVENIIKNPPPPDPDPSDYF